MSRSRPSSSARLEALLQEPGQAAVELDGGDRGAGAEQPGGQEPQPRPDLQQAAAGLRIGSLEDLREHVRVGQEVLR